MSRFRVCCTGNRAGVVAARLAVVGLLAVSAAASVPQLVGDARASSVRERARLAKRLLERDPGRRVGGVTRVGTARGSVLRGAPHRINFMMALGDREALIGGDGHDELGGYLGTRGVRIHGGGGPDLIHGMGLGDRLSGGMGDDRIYGGSRNDTIRGGPGSDTIYGGRGRDTINGGAGDDRIIDVHGTTTVTTGAGRDLVKVRDGRGDDRVTCPPGGRARVVADGGDRLSRGCRRMPARAASLSARPVARAPRAHAAQTFGSGTNLDPYYIPCPPNGTNKCGMTFPARTLQKLWSNEYVPSYGCQYVPNDASGSYSFFVNQNFAPSGTTLVPGVGVQGLGPIGVLISNTRDGGNSARPAGDAGLDYSGETETGVGSSATNWEVTPNSYAVVLVCTSFYALSYPATD